MNNNVKDMIMGQSRHLFVYGEKSQERTSFLKGLEDDYPIKCNEDSPMAIYLDDFGLPSLPNQNPNIDKIRIKTIGREFFNASLTYKIVNRLMKKDDLSSEQISYFLKNVSRINLPGSDERIASLEELTKLLKETKDFYQTYYHEYVKENPSLPNFNEIKMPFIELNGTIIYLKKALKNDSYFGIIIDHNEPISLTSTQVINGIVTRRINKDISMKIVTEPDKWLSFYDQSGELAEATHDYGVVELDSSLKQYVKKMKNSFNNQ